MMAGSARAISIRPTGPALLAGASVGSADATQIETANPIAAKTWIYLGNQKRIRTQNLKEAAAANKRKMAWIRLKPSNKCFHISRLPIGSIMLTLLSASKVTEIEDKDFDNVSHVVTHSDHHHYA